MTVAVPIEQRFGVWLPAVVILMWIICGAIYLTLPPSPDQFELAYLGWQMLEGAIPYRDFIDMNWPGVFWMHALSTLIFGNSLWSWRATDIIMVALSAFFLQDLLKRTAGATAAVLSLLLYPLFYVSLPQWFSGQSDMTAGQFLLMALWFHVRANELHAWRWQIGAGFFLAAAMLNKPTVGVLGVLLTLHGLLLGIPRRRVAIHTAVAAGAAFGGLLVALIAVLAQGASLREVSEATYTYNVWTQFLESASIDELARRFVEVHIFWWHYLSFLAVIGGVWLFMRGPQRPAMTALPILWLCGLLSYWIQHRGFAYHLAPCFIPIVGLVSAALGLYVDAGWKMGSRSWTIAFGPLLAVLVFAGGVWKLDTNYPLLPAALLRGDYSLHLARYQEGDGLTVADAVALTRRIEQAIPAVESVLVLGSASSMNYLSRRPQPTRFYYAPVLINARPPLPMADRWIDLFEGDLMRSRPRWCLISKWARNTWLDGDSRGAQILRAFLAAHYRKIGVVGADDAFEIYERM